MLEGIAALPSLLAEVRDLQRQIASMAEELARRRDGSDNPDGWLGPREAAKYLGISMGTFDKFRYEATPRLKGSALDGKTLFKKADLDVYVRLYSLKSAGLS